MNALIKNLILLLVSISITIFSVEYFLYYFYPISVTNVGYAHRPNGHKYGWGFYPNELVRVENPDTSEVHFDRVNKAGWRDRDRNIVNPDGAFRVLVLGDSMTFGYIVPKEQTYSAILEDKLKIAGVDAEVINISYSGWGTDQVYEALSLEGKHYKPDLVVYYFVGNDMEDNIWHQDSGKFGARKPFYYDIEGDGIVRVTNERFTKQLNRWTRKRIISQSEILKRAWIVLESVKHRRESPYQYNSRLDNRIQYFLDIQEDHVLFKKLRMLPEELQKADLDLVALESGITETQKSNLQTILTVTGGNNAPLIDGINWVPSDFSEYHWVLTRQLLVAISDVTKTIGAGLAIITDQESGRYNWDRSWLRVADGDLAKAQFFELNVFLQEMADRIDADFIPTPVPHERAKFDSHANAKGNEAIAENIYLYIKQAYPRLNIP